MMIDNLLPKRRVHAPQMRMGYKKKPQMTDKENVHAYTQKY